MPTIPSGVFDIKTASAGLTPRLNIVLGISTIQITFSFVLSKGSARAAGARPGPLAFMKIDECVGEAGRVAQASSLACSHCKTFGGGPRDNLDRFLQHKSGR